MSCLNDLTTIDINLAQTAITILQTPLRLFYALEAQVIVDSIADVQQVNNFFTQGESGKTWNQFVTDAEASVTDVEQRLGNLANNIVNDAKEIIDQNRIVIIIVIIAIILILIVVGLIVVRVLFPF